MSQLVAVNHSVVSSSSVGIRLAFDSSLNSAPHASPFFEAMPTESAAELCPKTCAC